MLTTFSGRRLAVIVPPLRVGDPVRFGETNTRPKPCGRQCITTILTRLFCTFRLRNGCSEGELKIDDRPFRRIYVRLITRRRPVETLYDSNERIMVTRPIRVEVDGRLFS